MADILILYYSVNESTKNMGRLIARGVETIDGANAILRTVSDKVMPGKFVATVKNSTFGSWLE